LKLVTPEAMQYITDVVKTLTPSWLDSIPLSFGEATAATLKANEWRTTGVILGGINIFYPTIKWYLQVIVYVERAYSIVVRLSTRVRKHQ
jgi:hypothetical protein